MADRAGQQFGNYRLVRLLGQGGYAEVYLGQHLRLNQQAAIKVLHAHLTETEAGHFQQEAQTISTLVHPSIIRVFDYDVQDGIPFLVMDYAPNGSLRQRYLRGIPAPLTQIVSYVKQVANALQYAHEQKFIQRDIKPENMLVGRRDEVLLSDFGIATIAHSSSSLSTQGALGTLSYMAPEQIEGHPRAASDQYALGCVVYEWLCGSRPFEGSPTEVMVKYLSMPPPALRERMPPVSLEVEQVVLRALAKDPKARFPSVHDFAVALEQASQLAFSPTSQLAAEHSAPGLPSGAAFATVVMPNETPSERAVPAESPQALPEMAVEMEPGLTQRSGSGAEITRLPVPHLRRSIAGRPARILIGLVVLVVAGGILGSVSLLAHFGVIGARSSATAPVRGGTWTDYYIQNPDSFIPNSSNVPASGLIDQALYLPLFYGDAQGVIHPGAASEVPTVQNGGVSADAITWTFHLRPHLVWSDGEPYDARDVDYTWHLWLNPKFSPTTSNPFQLQGLNLISSAEVSADNLTIRFYLKHAYAPFLSMWVDGVFAPLPAHHFSSMAPEAILKSPDNLNPPVVSGPFMMAESVSGDHYTLVRNPRYYRAREGLPYLDKAIFRVAFADQNIIPQDLQAGTVTSAWFLDVSQLQAYQRLQNYALVKSPTSASFEGMYFNFHNTILASHLEVRTAIAMAIDHQALIDVAHHGLATLLCTDHGSALHPGYEPTPGYCPLFAPAVANKLLDDKGWAKGPDGVRSRGGERLEFEYSTATLYAPWRIDDEAIVERNMQAIGIKLDIQNYPISTFFGPFLNGGKASPPSGAVVGRYDIAQWDITFGYDPDDSSLLSCDQIPPHGAGFNDDFYCNPALDALYRQEQTTADPAVRQQIFQQIHQIYLTQFPFIVLYSPMDFAIVHKGAHNYQISPFEGDTVNIWEWWCDNGKC